MKCVRKCVGRCVGKCVGILLMTTPQGVVESNLRGESKNRFFDSMLRNSPLSRHFVQEEMKRLGQGGVMLNKRFEMILCS